MGWPGDTLTQQPRPLNFGSLDEHLTQYKADVIIACFGMGESYQGSAALKRFETDWRNFILHSGEQRYNGKTAPRLVSIKCIFEKLLGQVSCDNCFSFFDGRFSDAVMQHFSVTYRLIVVLV